MSINTAYKGYRETVALKGDSDLNINSTPLMDGEYEDRIYKDGKLVEVIRGENLIVNSIKPLLAGLLANDPRYKGITYWAIGDGSPTWDIPQQPQIYDLTITSDVVTQGYILLTLNTQPYQVLVYVGDTAKDVVDRIVAMSFSSWTILRQSDTVIAFTSTIAGTRTQGSSYDPGVTGTEGILSLVQEGNATTARPVPAPTDTQLVHEFTRKLIDPANITYIDTTGNPVTDPTDILEVYCVFAENEAVGMWREFGIYGGTATADLNSGQMINHKITGVIDKSQDALVIERRIRFTFR